MKDLKYTKISRARLSGFSTYLDGLIMPEYCIVVCYELDIEFLKSICPTKLYGFEVEDHEDSANQYLRMFPFFTLRNPFDIFSGEQYFGDINLGNLSLYNDKVIHSSYIKCGIEMDGTVHKL